MVGRRRGPRSRLGTANFRSDDGNGLGWLRLRRPWLRLGRGCWSGVRVVRRGWFGSHRTWRHLHRQHGPDLLYQGVITLGFAYVAFGWGLKRLAPSVVIMLTILEPVIASILAVVVLDESPSSAAVVGGLLVFAGLPLAGLSAGRSRSTVDT
ncbi:MAG: EamA family transporter [Actinobacteria bacterium]|nr:EamA family transporter [Actinomycetota bacterium]